MEVSLACVVAQSAGRSVAGWWLGGAVRCGCLAGSVLWGLGRATRARGSGRSIARRSVGLPSLGACALVSWPLGVLDPSPGRGGRAFVLFGCL